MPQQPSKSKGDRHRLAQKGFRRSKAGCWWYKVVPYHTSHKSTTPYTLSSLPLSDGFLSLKHKSQHPSCTDTARSFASPRCVGAPCNASAFAPSRPRPWSPFRLRKDRRSDTKSPVVSSKRLSRPKTPLVWCSLAIRSPSRALSVRACPKEFSGRSPSGTKRRDRRIV